MLLTQDRELKKGNAELIVLALLEQQARHGYDIGKLIEERSKGVLRFHVASLYPLLYRLERRGWITGDWQVAGGRRRRYYRLTRAGRKVLVEQRARWKSFSTAMNRIVEVRCA
jgi:PadR family transcriptional regulator, regulatory protein PadR